MSMPSEVWEWGKEGGNILWNHHGHSADDINILREIGHIAVGLPFC